MTAQNVMMDNLVESIKATLTEANMLGFASYTEQTLAFFHAVDWTQPWIISVIVFHLLCFLISIKLRNNHDALPIYFMILMGMAALTQPLNSLAIQHWSLFSTESYFDTSGLFIVSVYAFPLIFNCSLTLAFILRAVVSTLIKAKRAQLKSRARNSSKNKKQE
ncbi:transmembrane protein 18-domain-containing protein [Mucor mucedo]|uniref:transmembrane protein 18-domain-containing protein n=1 Tax=Mucor mucedo TaxID=29922 RepID=UPI00221FB4C0|nr:transmembrane protein 18-domain-containing protein [Mucor mucedo]KAI7895703.1 transmembrane protein 18-domain-containing protein [Mucor mucedo]